VTVSPQLIAEYFAIVTNQTVKGRPMSCRLGVLLLLPCILLLASCGGDGAPSYGADFRVATMELDATYPEGFSYISGVRELSDGTLLAADPISQVVVRFDLDTGTADTLGRQGAGPEEYAGPDKVFPLPGDSTLLVDLGNARLIVIDPEGEFVRTTPLFHATGDRWPRNIQPRFVDDAGSFYASGPFGQEGPPDTISIHRIDPLTLEETPVASAWRTEYVRRPRGAKRPMMLPFDDWAVGGDGRVAVVRVNGFSLDWYLPDGTLITGPASNVEVFPLGQAEQEADLANMAATGIMTMSTANEDGVQSMSMSRGISADVMPSMDDVEWPENLPIFRGEGTRILANGEAWVERYMPVGMPARYEVFDDQAHHIGFLELPPASRIIGFGRGAESTSRAYVTRTDDLGLVWLERYRIVRNDSARETPH